MSFSNFLILSILSNSHIHDTCHTTSFSSSFLLFSNLRLVSPTLHFIKTASLFAS
nr:MAG TPA: hypothetical protein [Caudoviricetes sp.]